MGLLSQLDDYGLWLAAVVGGLGALGWLGRRVYRIARTIIERAHDVARKIDTLDALAGYELKANGGGSIKDRVGKIPSLEAAVADLTAQAASHERNLRGIRADQRDTKAKVEELDGRVASLAIPATSVVVGPDTTTVETKAAGT